MTPSSSTPLSFEPPSWFQTLREAYSQSQACIFIVHGNIDDFVFYQEALHSARDLLWDANRDPHLKSPRRLLEWSPRRGLLERQTRHQDSSLKAQTPESILTFLESEFFSTSQSAPSPGIFLSLPHASSILPQGDPSFWSPQERMLVSTFVDWSLDARFHQSPHLMVLFTPSLQTIPQRILSSPRVQAIEWNLPQLAERHALISHLTHRKDSGVDLIARHTGGLKLLQIADLLGAPRPHLSPQDGILDEPLRRQWIESWMQAHPSASNLSTSLESWVRITGNMNEVQLHELFKTIEPESSFDPASVHQEADRHLLSLLNQRKRRMIEQECHGLLEFIDTPYGLDRVGGQEPIKRELLSIAALFKQPNRSLMPMGIMAVGPMGSGKTFVIKAFLHEIGMTAVSLKNVRSKWVGATESNLDRILSTLQAMGPVALIIDEADRAFGGASSESGDSGTQSRMIARLKEFMADPQQRGQVLFVMMTNRPDKLDADLKRPGRLDRKIPFFYAQTTQEISTILSVQFRALGLEPPFDFDDPQTLSLLEPLIGYSNADLESLVSLYGSQRLENPNSSFNILFKNVIQDFIPPQDSRMIHYMNLLAIKEASRRSLLPDEIAQRYPTSTLDSELQSARSAILQHTLF